MGYLDLFAYMEPIVEGNLLRASRQSCLLATDKGDNEVIPKATH